MRHRLGRSYRNRSVGQGTPLQERSLRRTPSEHSGVLITRLANALRASPRDIPICGAENPQAIKLHVQSVDTLALIRFCASVHIDQAILLSSIDVASDWPVAYLVALDRSLDSSRETVRVSGWQV